MIKKPNKNALRLRRHSRVRRKIAGTGECPRLCVFRSNKNMYAQIIDDEKGVTIVAASTLEPEVKAAVESGAGKDAAKAVGQAVAKKAVDAGITEVVFDRGGYRYHGRVRALADAAREAGLEF